MNKQEKFWRNVDKSGECWEWCGTLNRDGYGISSDINGMVLAHRIAYTLCRGDIPEGLCVLHTCDVRRCVNPDHFFLGTRGDNCRDRAAKGRTVASHCYGEDNGKSNLTKEQVTEIKRLYTPKSGVMELSKRFGVSHSSVINIAVGRRRVKGI